MTLDKLSSSQREKLCLISQQGMAQAAGMLSRLLRQAVEVEVADAWMSDCSISDRTAAESYLGVYMQVGGDTDGGFLLALSESCAEWLCGQLLGTSADQNLLEEPGSSTLREVGNIIASSFLASIDDQLGLRAMPSPPQLTRAPLGELLKGCQSNSDEACLIVRTRLLGAGEMNENLQAAIYLFAEQTALEQLLVKIESA